MRHQALLFLCIALATAAYPLVIYYGLTEFGPRALALLLFVMLLVRALLWSEFTRIEKTSYLLLVGGLCLFAAWFQSEEILRYYPVLMNFGLACFFWSSLFTERPLIERFASIVMDEIPPHVKRYLYNLTIIWAGILTANAMVSLFTACCLPLKHWALYNGVIVYVIFGLFSLGELVVRHFYKKRHEG